MIELGATTKDSVRGDLTNQAKPKWQSNKVHNREREIEKKKKKKRLHTFSADPLSSVPGASFAWALSVKLRSWLR